MKQVFKPLGIAAAVAAASASYVNVASAQPAVANNALGDLAIVPYYTVNDEWITGIHLVNTSDKTQVVKFRFRRALDSMDALDFNVIMSPKDVYAGFLSVNASDDIVWSANDTTCTVPEGPAITMPAIFREGAETGYVEIIAMGQPTTERDNLGEAAKHSGISSDPSLTPKSCDFVRDNFFADGLDGSREGVIDYMSTSAREASDDQLVTDADTSRNWITTTYEDSGDVLKVSYFIRDNATGVEFGDNAVHIQGFLDEPALTNQEFGYFSGDLDGFDFPDLDGGSPIRAAANPAARGKFNLLRDGSVLGVDELFNEWVANPANGAALDWVVTLPGQYLMLHRTGYIASLTNDLIECVRTTDPLSINPQTGGATILANLASDDVSPVQCDFRDLPVTATPVAYNREETDLEPEDRELVVSPSPPGEVNRVRFEKEVNVVTFGGQSVLGVSDVDVTVDLGQPFGWLALSVSPASGQRGICEFNTALDTGFGTAGALDLGEILGLFTCPPTTPVTGNVPMVGFAAWQRSVAANPDASYGRIIAHSFSSGS
jgi:hypothetical protein